MNGKVLAAATLTAALGLAACVMPGFAPPPPTGAEDFATLCAPCHGPTGVGNGEMASGLDHPPADLTGLSRRNGGVFPMRMVMAKIWGYAGGGAPAAIMPQFGPLLDSETVLFDSGDGIQTPTPSRLVELANYLTTIQK